MAKAIAVDTNLRVVYDGYVSYDDDLPEFGTNGGFHMTDDKDRVTAPSAMYIKAIDMLLDKMVQSGFDFGRVVALAGDGQVSILSWDSVQKCPRHGRPQDCGSIYWKRGARQRLNNLDVNMSLYEQLKDAFSIAEPPIWMDSTNTKQVRQLEDAVGGPEELARITGARAYTHKTGPTIMKVFQTQRQAYDNTERISLITSLIASLFLGDYAAVDYGDGSVMSLLDVTTFQWSPKCLQACAPDLAEKLGEPVAPDRILGNVSSYLVKKYNFSAECKVLPFTSDCDQSLIGLGAKPGELSLTLGTADCFMYIWESQPVPNLTSSLYVTALEPYPLVTIQAFANGSLMRQHVMERCAGSWEKFSEMFNSTPPGNDGNIGIYFDITEVIPMVKGVFRFNKHNEQVETFPPEVEVRAVIEGQLFGRLMYAKKSKLPLGPNCQIVATGGASANQTLLQTIADVSNTPVFTIDVPNSAPLGGCYRAKMAIENIPYDDIMKDVQLHKPVCAALPTPGLEKVYEDMLARYEKLEAQIAAKYDKREK